MKDLLGNELNIGDMVVCPIYEELSIGRIRFTPKKAEVKMKLGLSYTSKESEYYRR